MPFDVRHKAEQALDEVRAVLTALTSSSTETFAREVLDANRIALYGVGREGLMMKAFGMRLFHLGLQAHIVGDMTTPPIGEGDLLIVSAGPGSFSTVQALIDVAKEAGARTLVITATPEGGAARASDAVVHLPAQTMADDLEGPASLLPMGSAFEIAQLVYTEMLILLLRDRLGQRPEEMRQRHTNLE